MYDWANSVYNLVITSTIFPAYYEGITRGLTPNNEVHFLGRTYVNTVLYDYALAFSFLVVAVASPILSSIADYRGNKRIFLRFFSTMGSLACMSLFFFHSDNISFGISAVILASIGFWSSLVFYNSYLPDIASPANQDRVSSQGFAYGYIGSVLLQLCCFVVLFKKEWFGIAAENETLPAQISFVMVGLWWLGFSQIPLANLPRGSAAKARPEHGLIVNGFIELRKVWQQLKSLKELRLFLFGFFFYNMAVQTVMLMATLFGKKELHLETPQLIVTILVIQLVAIAGAWAISRLSDKFGNMKVLAGTILFWIFICVGAYYTYTSLEFYVLAGFVGFVMGGIQSLSRSSYSKLMPETHDTTSFFSFFDVTEKVAIATGLLGYGLIEELTGNMRNSILVLMVFFAIGLLFILRLRKVKL